MFKGYSKPTPKKLRRLGDGLLILSTSIAGYAMANDYPTVEFVVMVSGVAGKFLTNFFSED